jgi:lactoylglutathione lyase
MLFGYTTIYVPDVNAAIEFYERAFGFSRKRITSAAKYGELETGVTTLSFATNEMAREHLDPTMVPITPEGAPAGVTVSFIANDVGTAYKNAVDNGAVPVAPPLKKPWGQTVAYVRDLNGLIVELCSKIER